MWLPRTIPHQLSLLIKSMFKFGNSSFGSFWIWCCPVCLIIDAGGAYWHSWVSWPLYFFPLKMFLDVHKLLRSVQTLLWNRCTPIKTLLKVLPYFFAHVINSGLTYCFRGRWNHCWRMQWWSPLGLNFVSWISVLFAWWKMVRIYSLGIKSLGFFMDQTSLGLVRSGSDMHLLLGVFPLKDDTSQLFVSPKDCFLQDLELKVCSSSFWSGEWQERIVSGVFRMPVFPYIPTWKKTVSQSRCPLLPEDTEHLDITQNLQQSRRNCVKTPTPTRWKRIFSSDWH